MRGTDIYLWEPENTGDLLALAKEAGEQDAFARWIADYPLGLFHCYIGRHIFKSPPGDEESGFVRYSDTKLAHISAGVGTVLASIFPVISVICLTYIESSLLRLGAVGISMFLFSVLLLVFTKARRVEVFAATCAYVGFFHFWSSIVVAVSLANALL